MERGGSVGTFHAVAADKETFGAIVSQNVARETRLTTDESTLHTAIGVEFPDHKTVCRSAGEYVRSDARTNTTEGYSSIFKREMRDICRHCREKHLHRYLAEFDLRYNSRIGLGVGDLERTERALAGIAGKRLVYRNSVLAVA